MNSSNMKTITCIAILNLFQLGFCASLIKFNNTGTINRNVSCSVITRNDVNFALKLLKSIPYDPTRNQVISPLALKLSLLSFASVSANQKQTQAIYSFIFDDANVGQDDVRNVNESQILEQLNSTVEATTQHYPDERMEFYNRFNWRHKIVSDASPARSWPRRGKNRNELDLLLCASFDESHENETALDDCRRYVQSDDNLPKNGKLKLSSRQNIQLCRSFGVQSYLDCIGLLAEKTSDESYFTGTERNTFKTIRDCVDSHAWQIARIFHTVPDLEKQQKYGQSQNFRPRSINNFIYQFLFTRDRVDGVEQQLNETERTQWKQHFDWYGLRQFDSENVTQMREWKLFKKNTLSGLLLPELVSIPSPSSHVTELLNVVMIDKRLQTQFWVEKRHFYGPRFNQSSAFVDQEQIFQVETLVNHAGNFSIEDYFDGQWNHTLLRLPYSDHRYSLVLALPDPAGATIPDLLRKLSLVQLHHYLRLLHTGTKRVAQLALPRFEIYGKMDALGALLSRSLNVSSLNLTLQSSSFSFPLDINNIQQLIRVTNFGANEMNVASFNTWDTDKHANSWYFKRFNRPFVYMLVGKYLELHARQPSFEIIATGFYNGPEQMIRV